MLEALKFVKGAVSTKNIVDDLRKFQIRDGRVLGYNGRIALSAPIDLELEAYPEATMFIKAIENCKDVTSIHLTQSRRLAVKSGGFKCYIDCLENVHYTPKPSGPIVDNPGSFRDALETASLFISEDASRPHCHGVFIKGKFMYATNNVCIIKVFSGVDLPTMNLPKEAVRELLRNKSDPERIQVSPHDVTFYYGDGKWLHSLLLEGEWMTPKLEGLFSTPTILRPIPDDWMEGVNSLFPFLTSDGNAVYVKPDRVSTVNADDLELGATMFVDYPDANGIFTWKYLMLICQVASHFDPTDRGGPCVFQGSDCIGVILPRGA